MKVYRFIYILLFIIFLYGCSEKKEVNKVDMEQINIDESNNYNYIFRKDIEEENRKKNRYKKDDF